MGSKRIRGMAMAAMAWSVVACSDGPVGPSSRQEPELPPTTTPEQPAAPPEQPPVEPPASPPEPPVTPTPPVTPPPTTGAYSITVRYVGTPSARQRGAVEAAVARWQSVITSDLVNVPVTAAAGTCFPTQPAVNETVDDLLLFVDFAGIDGAGKVLGSAGPCYIRTGSNLPLLGYLKLDADDLWTMEQAGTLDDVVLHEIGHVLGIGTLWGSVELVSGAGGADPGFTGAKGMAAYRGMGGMLAAVPVENTGGTGTRDSHWRESVFGSELMTGYIGASGNPLSALTIASLQDLGYGATTAAATTFSLVRAQAGVRGGTELHGRERIVRPKYRVDARGRKEALQPIDN